MWEGTEGHHRCFNWRIEGIYDIWMGRLRRRVSQLWFKVWSQLPGDHDKTMVKYREVRHRSLLREVLSEDGEVGLCLSRSSRRLAVGLSVTALSITAPKALGTWHQWWSESQQIAKSAAASWGTVKPGAANPGTFSQTWMLIPGKVKLNLCTRKWMLVWIWGHTRLNGTTKLAQCSRSSWTDRENHVPPGRWKG